MEDTLSGLIQNWSENEEEVLNHIFKEKFSRLYSLSRKTLGDLPGAETEAEDAVQSAVKSLCRYFRNPKNVKNKDSSDCWRFLTYLVVVKSKRRFTKQLLQNVPISNPPLSKKSDNSFQLQDLLTAKLSLEEFDSLLCESLEELPDEVRSVAILLIKGYSKSEVARFLDCSTRTITRKLNLIRQEIQELAGPGHRKHSNPPSS